MAKDKALKKGDRVSWNTPQGRTTGTVKKRLTSETHIKGHKAAASTDHPEYLVESEKSGKPAAHRPGEVRKLKK